MSYSEQDVDTRKGELLAAMPELELNDEKDWGLQLRVTDPETGETLIVMRPRRFYQTELNTPTERIVSRLQDYRHRHRQRTN